MELDPLKKILDSSTITHARDACTLMERLPTFHYQTAKDIHALYSERQEFLSNKQGRHAQQLHQSIVELLNNLQANIDCHVACIETRRLSGYYYLIYITDSQVLLGCLRVISQKDVSEECWRELWDLV